MYIKENTLKNRFKLDNDGNDDIENVSGVFSGSASLITEGDISFARFNGGRISVNSPVLPSYSSFTILCRIRSSSTGYQVIYNNIYNGGGNTTGFYIALYNQKISVARLDGVATGYYLGSNSTLELNRWYDVIYSYNKTNGIQSIYIDGKLDAYSVFKSDVNYIYNSRIGYYVDFSGYTRPFIGDIDYIHVYKDSVENFDYLIKYNNKFYNIEDSKYDTNKKIFLNISKSDMDKYTRKINENILFDLINEKTIEGEKFKPIDKFNKFKICKLKE